VYLKAAIALSPQEKNRHAQKDIAGLKSP